MAEEILPNSRWMEIEGAGHVVYLEEPITFFSLMRLFMKARSTDFEAPVS